MRGPRSVSVKALQWSTNETRKFVSTCSAWQHPTDTLFKVNLGMATESTQLARASHKDSRALRVIQILSILFLPASLISSIFGMGFFTTSQGADGQAIFSVSNKWWLYIAISIPVTILCLIFMGGYQIAFKLKAKRETPSDPERAA